MLPDRYSKQKFIEALDNPEKFANELKNIIQTLRKKYFKFIHGEGVEVMAKDWDNLIILDALRYDIFKEYNPFNGDLEQKISLGSYSPEFIRKNFEGGDFYDTVCISGNGHYSTVGVENNFYNYIYAYEHIKNKKHQKLDSETIYESVLGNQEEYNDKRLIVHFMKPHAPYLGSKAERIRDELSKNYDIQFRLSNTIDENTKTIYNTLLHSLEDGYISRNEALEVYIENLELVLEYVEKLLENINGKTIITSDHGELLGEPLESINKKFYPINTLHGRDIYVPELRKIPWLVIENGDRRNISSENHVQKEDIDSETIDQHLRALGYK